jgi:hypothetical protein
MKADLKRIQEYKYVCFGIDNSKANDKLGPSGQEQAVFHQRIAPQLESYFGTRFEKLCQEALVASYRRQQVLWQHVGQYWDDEMQIDVVGVRLDKWIDFGECKWGGRKVSQSC